MRVTLQFDTCVPSVRALVWAGAAVAARPASGRAAARRRASAASAHALPRTGVVPHVGARSRERRYLFTVQLQVHSNLSRRAQFDKISSIHCVHSQCMYM